eukprot:364830-Chlamydomonas_euryale.AAC.8
MTHATAAAAGPSHGRARVSAVAAVCLHLPTCTIGARGGTWRRVSCVVEQLCKPRSPRARGRCAQAAAVRPPGCVVPGQRLAAARLQLKREQLVRENAATRTGVAARGCLRGFGPVAGRSLRACAAVVKHRLRLNEATRGAFQPATQINAACSVECGCRNRCVCRACFCRLTLLALVKLVVCLVVVLLLLLLLMQLLLQLRLLLRLLRRHSTARRMSGLRLAVDHRLRQLRCLYDAACLKHTAES